MGNRGSGFEIAGLKMEGVSWLKSLQQKAGKARFQRYLVYAVMLMVIILFWFALPSPLFQDPLSTVLLDCNGNLLGAKISDDQQWRFPESEDVPEKFRLAIIHYEDRYFRYHPGVNPVALLRAAYLNIKH